MRPAYYVIDTATNTPIPAVIRPAAWRDFQKTENEYWQTSWLSKFIQQDALEKYALELRESKELVGLGAYRNVPEGVLVAVEYIESSPDSNPTQTNSRKFRGIGAALLAFGIQLSIEWLWRHNLFEGKNLRIPGTLHPGFWSNSLQPHRPVHAFDRWSCRKKSVFAVFRGVNNVGREIS